MTGSARMDDEQYLANVVSEVSLLENHENLNPKKSRTKYVAPNRAVILSRQSSTL